MRALGIGLLALTLVACGGSDSEESGAASPAGGTGGRSEAQAQPWEEPGETADTGSVTEEGQGSDAESTGQTDAESVEAGSTSSVEETSTGSEDALAVEDTVTPEEEDISATEDAVAVEDTVTPEEEDISATEDVAVAVPDTTEEAEEEKDLSELDLNGSIPVAALAPPTFLAENYDGGTRTEADLIGKPTVMWFFPFAGTPG